MIFGFPVDPATKLFRLFRWRLPNAARAFVKGLTHEQTRDHLRRIREVELQRVEPWLPPGSSILEIGAGVGWQAKALSELGYEVSAIDVPTSKHRENREWPIVEYDGVEIPFPDRSFDVVFSSNVMEHIPDVRSFQKEIMRVLKTNGFAIHVVPSGSWRFWTNVSHFVRNFHLLQVRSIRTLMPQQHGEVAGNCVSEVFFFSRFYWRRLFSSAGWRIDRYRPNRLFYTGYSVMDCRWSLSTRRRISSVLGNSCHMFKLTVRRPNE